MAEGPIERVMLAVDEADLRRLCGRVLERIGGWTVLACADRRTTIEQAAAFAPDLVISDVMMPGLGGPATLQGLRFEGCLGDVPVVFMTAKALPKGVAALNALRVDAVLIKPFDLSELGITLKAVRARRHGG
ncbi:MAG: two-component system OmpR family response regulator [Paracoccaceae bacterium]|jgi:two-component system OmpR family response regulator